MSRQSKPKRHGESKRNSASAKKRSRQSVKATGLQAIHRNIKKIREERGLTYDDISKAAKVDPTAVMHWEAGRTAPVASRIPLVALALGVTIDELYAEDAA